jgi:hypothetical protein
LATLLLPLLLVLLRALLLVLLPLLLRVLLLLLARTCTSKDQLSCVGISHTMSVVLTSQQMVRWSLEQLSSRLWSWGHHDMPITPCRTHAGERTHNAGLLDVLRC